MTGRDDRAQDSTRGDRGLLRRLKASIDKANRKRERGFDRFREGYGNLLASVLERRAFTLIAAALVGLIDFALLFLVGTDFFPEVDAGIMELHLRAPSGTRIEETEKLVERVEAADPTANPGG